MHLHRFLLFLLIGIFTVSCNNKDDQCTSTWIGGEIINPKGQHVLISHAGKLIDTVKLDENNFFRYELHVPEEGLYSIRHWEYQMFHLSPGDSLMLRVNTMDFDESLTYSGKGAEKNNILMELFLMNEENTKIMPMVYQLPPSEFLVIVDSLHEKGRDYLTTVQAKNKLSKNVKDIATATIDYNCYSKKELYVSANADNPEFEHGEKLPKDYFDYRNNLNLNDDELQYYFPYTIFLNRYLDNIAHHKNTTAIEYDRNSFDHNKAKLTVIDSLITVDSLRNSLFRSTARRYLLNAKHGNNANEMVRRFDDLSTSSRDKKNIAFLAASTSKLTPGSQIPNIQLVSVDNENEGLKELITHKTVIFFWSAASVAHYKDIHIKAAELKSKYPEYDFLGVNTDTNFKKWVKVVQRNAFSKHNEYQIENLQEAGHKLAINSINKAIIVDSNGMILESNANVFDPVIETHLVGYLNR